MSNDLQSQLLATRNVQAGMWIEWTPSGPKQRPNPRDVTGREDLRAENRWQNLRYVTGRDRDLIDLLGRTVRPGELGLVASDFGQRFVEGEDFTVVENPDVRDEWINPQTGVIVRLAGPHKPLVPPAMTRRQVFDRELEAERKAASEEAAMIEAEEIRLSEIQLSERPASKKK